MEPSLEQSLDPELFFKQLNSRVAQSCQPGLKLMPFLLFFTKLYLLFQMDFSNKFYFIFI